MLFVAYEETTHDTVGKEECSAFDRLCHLMWQKSLMHVVISMTVDEQHAQI